MIGDSLMRIQKEEECKIQLLALHLFKPSTWDKVPGTLSVSALVTIRMERNEE